MSIEIAGALALFLFAISITPGPNNLMLMASGANFGFRRTLPHMAGISIGVTAMCVLVGIGLIRVFDTYPGVYDVLRIACGLYLLRLTWKIATAAPPDGAEAAGDPMSFLQAASFQWVNPKTWTVIMTSLTVYLPDRAPLSVVAFAVVFSLTGIPVMVIWTSLGQQLRRVLSEPRHLRIFNWTMAALLVLSVTPALIG